MNFLCLIFLSASPVFAQQAMDEARDTIRFIRMAESKKQLGFEDQVLLALNEKLDAYEEKRFGFIHRENLLKRKVAIGSFSDEEAAQILAEIMKVKDEIHQNDVWLYQELQSILKPKQTLEFYVFYQQFQKDIFKRIRRIQEGRKGSNRRRQQKN